MNTCYRYSPEDVNLYLIDFKGGNEFKFYEANKVVANQIPHIKLTGLTSDVEDGIAIIIPGNTKQDATLIAKILLDGCYVEKEFEVSVSKEQQGPDLSDAKKLIYNKY